MAIEVFNRYEKKYLLDHAVFEPFYYELLEYMDPDDYVKQNSFYPISNIYFDTINDTLIRNLYIHGGTFSLDTKDDAVHSNGNVFITNGDFMISSGDDGIHADNNVMISGGTINILKSYEGIEATQVTISDGTIGIVASDDGLNAAGGNDGSSMNGRPGQNRFSRSTGTITISGGFITVDAMGDGVDSNGDIYMSGGTLLVNGPTANNNGALDYDGTFELSGGVLVAAGSSGMLQGPSTSTNQSSIIMQFSQTQKAGTIVRVEDQSGNDVITFAPSKNFQAIVVSSPNLKQGETYTIYTGGQATGSQTFGLYQDGSYEGGEEIVQFNIGDAVTWLNESGVTQGRNNRFGGPGRPGGKR